MDENWRVLSSLLPLGWQQMAWQCGAIERFRVRISIDCSQRRMPDPQLLQVRWCAPLPKHGDPRVPKGMQSGFRDS